MVWWCAAAGALCVAVLAGVGDWRRRSRADLDKIGMNDWPGVQIFALIAAAVCVIVATHGQ